MLRGGLFAIGGNGGLVGEAVEGAEEEGAPSEGLRDVVLAESIVRRGLERPMVLECRAAGGSKFTPVEVIAGSRERCRSDRGARRGRCAR